jgi:hypothetical protein
MEIPATSSVAGALNKAKSPTHLWGWLLNF